MLYGDWIGRWGSSFPEKEAVVDTISNRRYSYGDFAAQINKMANLLRSDLGVKQGDRVAVLALNRFDTLVLFFAVSRLGAILVPLNFRLATDEFVYFIEDATPSALFFDETHQKMVADLKPCLAIPQYVCMGGDHTVGLSMDENWGRL